MDKAIRIKSIVIASVMIVHFCVNASDIEAREIESLRSDSFSSQEITEYAELTSGNRTPIIPDIPNRFIITIPENRDDQEMSRKQQWTLPITIITGITVIAGIGYWMYSNSQESNNQKN